MTHAPVEFQLELDMLTQPDEESCGPTCLHAVYAFFGDTLPLDAVVSQTERLRDGGTLAVLLGCHAVARGYRATIYTYNLQVFDPSWRLLSSDDLIARLARQAATKDHETLHVMATAYQRFLSGGGQVRFEDLTPDLIRRLLRRRLPILTGLSSTYMYQTRREVSRDGALVFDDVAGHPMGHFVVLGGYDRVHRLVLVADPWGPAEHGPQSGKYWMSVNRVINSILLGMITFDANLLVIEPKNERGTVRAGTHCRQ